VLDSDEGARRLGSGAGAALSPISAGLFNTLFDENAACHIARAMLYEMLRRRREAQPEQIAEQGGNRA
jgi:leucyl aminopeptidase (aminopeptidase T)